MFWMILLVVHLIGLVGYSLLLRKQALKGKLHPWALATLLQTGIMIPVVLVAPFLPIDLGRYDLSAAGLTCLVIALNILLLVTVTKALQYLEVSTYAVIYNLRIIVATVLAAIVLHEFPSGMQIFGGILVLGATIIVRQKGSERIARRGLAWGVAATFTISILNVLEKQLVHDVGVYTAAPVVTGITGIIMWSVVALRNYPLPKKYIFNRQVVGLMVFRSLSAWGFVLALATGALVSVATFISTISVVLIVAFGALLLGERDYLVRKIIATVVVIIGLIAILFGTNT